MGKSDEFRNWEGEPRMGLKEVNGTFYRTS